MFAKWLVQKSFFLIDVTTMDASKHRVKTLCSTCNFKVHPSSENQNKFDFERINFRFYGSKKGQWFISVTFT